MEKYTREIPWNYWRRKNRPAKFHSHEQTPDQPINQSTNQPINQPHWKTSEDPQENKHASQAAAVVALAATRAVDAFLSLCDAWWALERTTSSGMELQLNVVKIH